MIAYFVAEHKDGRSVPAHLVQKGKEFIQVSPTIIDGQAPQMCITYKVDYA